MSPRPSSLAEVSQRSAQGESFESELADFLHEFAFCGEVAMLADEPALLGDQSERGKIYDAYLAAVAASLSSKIDQPAPSWTRHGERILREPWFSSPVRHMRALLLVESPAAFRERNLFVSANALSIA